TAPPTEEPRRREHGRTWAGRGHRLPLRPRDLRLQWPGRDDPNAYLARLPRRQARLQFEAGRHPPLYRRRAARSAEIRAYLSLARRLLEPAPARLVAIGALSGTGTSTLAAALGGEIGAFPG